MLVEVQHRAASEPRADAREDRPERADHAPLGGEHGGGADAPAGECGEHVGGALDREQVLRGEGDA